LELPWIQVLICTFVVNFWIGLCVDMDWSDGGGLQMGVEINMRELQDADAIVSLANDAGQISICGFGSLLSGSLDFSLHFHSPLALFFLGVCSSDFFLLLAIVCQSL
jgi:hypothetical protein